MPIEGRSGPPIKGVPNYEGLQWYFNTYREIRTEINRECEFPGQSPEGFFYGVREVVKSYFKRTYNPLGLSLQELRKFDVPGLINQRGIGERELYLLAMTDYHVAVTTDTEEGKSRYQQILLCVSRRQCFERECMMSLIDEGKTFGLNKDECLLLKTGMEMGVWWDELYSLWREVYLYKKGFREGDEEKLETIKTIIIGFTNSLAEQLGDSKLRLYFTLLSNAVDAIGKKAEKEEKELWDRVGICWGELDCRILPVHPLEVLHYEDRLSPEFALLMRDPHLPQSEKETEVIKGYVLEVLKQFSDNSLLQKIRDNKGGYGFPVLSSGARIDFSYAGQAVYGRTFYDIDSWLMGTQYRQERMLKVFGDKVVGEEDERHFISLYLIAHEFGHLYGQDIGTLEENKANLIALAALNYGMRGELLDHEAVEMAIKGLIAYNLKSFQLNNPREYKKLEVGGLRELTAALVNLDNACRCGLIVHNGEQFALDMTKVSGFLALSAEQWDQLAKIVKDEKAKKELFERIINIDEFSMVAAIRKKLIA